MGAEVFNGCLNLRKIEGAWSVDGVLYDYDVDGYSLCYYPPARQGESYEIPDGVNAIGAYVFDEVKYLKRIIIPQSVKKIYGSAICKPKNPVNVVFRGSLKNFSVFSYLSISALPIGSTITVRSQEDKDFLLNKIPDENLVVNIVNNPATSLTFKDGSTSETAIVKPGEIYTPTIKLAPYDTTDQVAWSYKSTDDVRSFDSYTGRTELNGNGKVLLTGRTGSGKTITSEVYFYLPCDRESLKVGFSEAQGFWGDRSGEVLRIPLTGAVSDQAQFYYADMWMNTDPINAEGGSYSYASSRMSMEASNPEIIQFDADTGKITPRALGTATITAKADDGPNGYITRSFTVQVVERSVMECQYYNAEGELYETGKVWGLVDKSQLVIKDGAYTLQKGIDYEVSYSNENPGQYVTIHIVGLGRYAGNRAMYCSYKSAGGGGETGGNDGGAGGNTGSGNKDDVPQKPSIVGVKDSYTQSYGGKAFTLKAKGKGKLSYTSSNKKVATVGKINGKVTLKEIGSTTITIKSSDASKKVKVQVVPRKPSIKAGASGKKAIKVTWKKDSKSTGYQLQLTTDKKYKKGIKSITVKKNKTTSYTAKKLSGKKTYYVRFRSYKTVSGKKYYSDWSSVKKVRTK